MIDEERIKLRKAIVRITESHDVCFALPSWYSLCEYCPSESLKRVCFMRERNLTKNGFLFFSISSVEVDLS